MKEVLETSQYVASNSRHVRINRPPLLEFAHAMVSQAIKIPPWDPTYHFAGEPEETVAYLLVLDTINFCFWPPPFNQRWKIGYGSEELSGYNALAASLKQAIHTGIPITDAGYLAGLTLGGLKQAIGGKGELPLLDRRLHNLNELGRVLLKEYDGLVLNLVGSAGGSAARLVGLLADKLSSYQDVATYEGRKIFFYKRAQLFAADLHSAFMGRGWGEFADIDQLTAFADYKLPQVLRHLGIISYDKALSAQVEDQAYLQPGSRQEVEIRANTVWSVELIRREAAKKGAALRSFEIDRLLWGLGQDDEYRKKPYHRTLTIFY